MPANTREQKSHTHMHEPASSNARDVHMLSNKLRPNDEQRMTCELRLHAQQYNGYYVNTFIPSMNKATALRVGCAGILEAEVAGIFSKSTSLDGVSLKTACNAFQAA